MYNYLLILQVHQPKNKRNEKVAPNLAEYLHYIIYVCVIQSFILHSTMYIYIYMFHKVLLV